MDRLDHRLDLLDQAPLGFQSSLLQGRAHLLLRVVVIKLPQVGDQRPEDKVKVRINEHNMKHHVTLSQSDRWANISP